MKIKKHVRRGSLAALIALALTSSALAMPTGGVVQSGDVNIGGSTDFSTVASGSTIGATTDSTINWDTFNIGNGETLNFNIADNKTLVNQVTGAQLSDILGTMNQTGGGGNVVLVNPNGIHIGATAVLNVPDLTLSALSIDQATDTTRVLKAGGGTGALAGQIVVDADAANHASFTANELNLIGQKVAVADGVVFDMGGTAGTGKAMLQVYATDNAAWTFDGSHMKTKNLTHNAGNDVTFGGTVNMTATNNSKNVEIGGATTQVKNAVFNGDKLETTAYAASKLSIDERDADINKHSFVTEATAANTLTADHIQAAGDSLSLGGGAVVLKNSTINVDDVSLDGVAKSATKGDGVRTETLTAPDRTVSIENTTLTANEVGVYGGKVDVANDVSFAPLAPGQRDFTVVAGNVDHEKSVYTTTTGNALAFHGKIDGFGTSDTHPIVLLGNTVNVDGANLGSVSPVGSLKIGAVNEVNAKDLATLAATATAANALSANGLTVKSPATTQFLGGTMTFTNANMDVAGEISVTTGALRELGNEARTITTAPDQKVTFAGTGTFKARSVDVRGGSVAVDSGITFEAKDPTHETGLDIVAGSESDDGHGAITYTMTRGNDLVFKGKSVNFGATTEEEPVALLGATVNLDGARIENASHVNTAAAQRIVSKNNGDKSVTAGTGNALSGDGLTINQGDVNVVGGNVALKNGSIHTGGDLTVMAVKTATLGSEKTAAASKNNVVHLDGVDVNAANARTISGKTNLVNNARVHANDVAFRVGQKFAEDHVDATKDNTLSMWNSHVSGADVTLAGGGAETYQGSTVAASNALKQGDVTHTDGAALSLVKDAVSSVQENGTDADGFTVKAAADVPPVPEKPVVPPAPSADETSLSAQDEENIDTGRMAAQDALVEPTQEKRAEALMKTVAQLNEKVGTSRRQTAGIVVGMVKEIAETSTLDAAAKLDLQRAVLDAYAPVQELKDEQDHHAVRTLADAVRAAENTLVTATTHEHDSSNVQPVTFMD